ncbi:MAG: 2Fe-2S iron-sulfur cluster-binding protein, partial [Flavobacteriaceae bacterium]|nr:2Fe-2S iron-sulfur cluster-binding protein [Flavobacteriaceae bacterium]
SANYCAFVAGSGITPLMSIVSDVLENNENGVFVLGYGNKTKASTMFSSAINELKSKYANRFFCYNIYSQENNSEANFGRINSDFINYVLKQHSQISFQKVLLCGPENMIENSKEVLEKLNYSDKKVLYELFYSKSDANVSESGSRSGSAAKIIYDEETIELDVPKKMTILDAALQKNIDVPYSCQGGVCSSCIAKITVGSATMIQNNILTDSEIKEGLVLTCQAIPETKEITVDFDDV